MIVQLRDQYEAFVEHGASLTVIGMGDLDQAATFKRQHRIPFSLLVDTKKESYRAVGLKRARWSGIVGPEVWSRGARSTLKRGIGVPRQDVRQLGGAAVIESDGTIRYLHRSRSSADNASVDDLLERLQRL